MYKSYSIEEVTPQNENQYLDGIANLENEVLNNMIQNGKDGQLFITGKEDIHEYIQSNNNHVVVAYRNIENNEKKAIAATYITEGQMAFTYNDLTKYFKLGDKFNKYIKDKYIDNKNYKSEIKRNYLRKIIAFRTVRDLCLNEFIDKEEYNKISNDSIKKNDKLMELIKEDYNNPESHFHEKSKLREYFNKQMSTYMKSIFENEEQYNDFYWINSSDLCNLIDVSKKNKIINDTVLESDINTYDKTLKYLKYIIYEQSKDLEIEKYYKANTNNTIELDTYITSPFERENGLARILVLEGLKIALGNQIKNSDDENVYLVSTLHRDNMSSKYVSEFFGLKDYLFVNRRNGRDREVHILKLEKANIPEYLETMEKKISVLYDYNSDKFNMNSKEKRKILKEQLDYEENEMDRLLKSEKKYPEYEERKTNKIKKLSEQIDLLER